MHLHFDRSLIALQGRWWFGSRQKTKDGINASSAAAFFKTLKEESSFEEVLVQSDQSIFELLDLESMSILQDSIAIIVRDDRTSKSSYMLILEDSIECDNEHYNHSILICIDLTMNV